MTSIRILPEIISNKIAAGEVVERPASVVKELIENALDAQSSRVHIEIQNGGRSLIRVSDNGRGMSRDDALLSIERYATSKIHDDTDLFAIRTLGFRGEALPSIAAVSRFSLVTRPENADAGCEIIVAGGRLQRVSDTGAPVGTMITVKQLFYNTPARRKFLKTTATEMSHIADTVASFALGRPEVQLRLSHNQKTIRNWTPTARPEDRIEAVLGPDIKKNLFSLQHQSDALALSGWIAAPRLARSTSRNIHLFVNGRRVKDRIIQHALCEGYQQRLMKGQFPLAVLFLQVPFEQVDVNVHPTKHEVRFVRPEEIHQIIRAVVSKTLREGDRPDWASPRFPDSRKPVSGAVRESAFRFGKGIPAANRMPNFETRSPAGPLSPDQTEIWRRQPFSDLKAIGQFHGTYLLLESVDELIVIDQHAAHERIVFEQLKKALRSSEKTSQKLLLPETLDLGFREAEILNRLIPGLAAVGLEIEPFGGNTFVVQAVPAALARREIGPLVIEMVEQVTATGFGSKIDSALEQCLVVMACHGTVRANQELTDREISCLLRQLDECQNPSHCPHGRPTWIRWPLNLIEKRFQRIPG